MRWTAKQALDIQTKETEKRNNIKWKEINKDVDKAKIYLKNKIDNKLYNNVMYNDKNYVSYDYISNETLEHFKCINKDYYDYGSYEEIFIDTDRCKEIKKQLNIYMKSLLNNYKNNNYKIDNNKISW